MALSSSRPRCCPTPQRNLAFRRVREIGTPAEHWRRRLVEEHRPRMCAGGLRRMLMRIWPVLLLGAAALVGSSGAIAAPISGSAIAAAAEQIGVGESVHCRPFRHWHPWGWARGCRGASICYDYGPRYRYGYRYGHRYG